MTSPLLRLDCLHLAPYLSRYLQESGFVHSAFTFAHESMLGRTGLRSVDKSLPPGALISFLQKGLQYLGVEETLLQQQQLGQAKKDVENEVSSTQDFSILSPTAIAALVRKDPPITLNVPPATAAAAVKARIEAQSRLQSKHQQQQQSVAAAAAVAATTGIPFMPQSVLENPVIARQALATQAAAAHAAAMSQLHHQHQYTPTFGQRPLIDPRSLSAAENLLEVNVPQINSAGSKRPAALAVTSPKPPGTKKKHKAKTENESTASTVVEGSGNGTSAMEIEPTTTTTVDTPLSNTSVSNSVADDAITNGLYHANNGKLGSPGSGGLPKVKAVGRKEVDDSDTMIRDDEVLKLEMHQSEVFMCAWNPVYTNFIATGSGDASARIWQMGGLIARDGLTSSRLLSHTSGGNDNKNKDVTTLEWSSDGTLLATGSYDGVARVWSRNGNLIHTLQGHSGPIFSLKWNRQGNYLLSGSYDKTTIVWDVSGPAGRIKQQFTGHSAPALDVDWKDNVTFASCSTDKTVHVCQVGQDQPLKIYSGHVDEVNAVKWSPCGRYLASCSDDHTAKVWDVESESTFPLYDLTSHQQEIYTVKWSPTGPGSANPSKKPLLATASFDSTVRLWDIADGSCYRVFDRHVESVYSVAFSPSGDYLVSGSLAGAMYIWDIEKGVQVKSYRGDGDIFEVAWNKEETRVAACFSSNAVAVVDFDKSSVESKP